MKRNENIDRIKHTAEWDVVVIGGGATGLGVAVDAASRGFSTLLLERIDFAKGTSSRSTKLVHGGVRYLAQGDVALVREALRERGRLAKNAPHLFNSESFIIPGEKWWTAYYYTFGLWLYDRLAGKLSIGHTRYLNKKETNQHLKGVKLEKLNNGVCYYDGQFDDARLAINLAQTAVEQGATVANYCEVIGLDKDKNGKICGVKVKDTLGNEVFDVKAKCVVNATGVFTNEINAMDKPGGKDAIVPSQGIHLVIDRKFLPGKSALMVPKTSDGRVLFAVPWHNKLVVGTTDTLVKNVEYEPKPIEQEIDFILQTAKDYLIEAPTREDVRSVFVGLRPLAAPKEEGKSTKEVSRSHKVEVRESGLIDVIGGKWTTYRQMAEDTLSAAIKNQLLSDKPCVTTELKIHGHSPADMENHLGYYGSDRKYIEELAANDSKAAEKLHPEYPFLYAEVLWAVREEMAQTLEDVLARRIRFLFLDAKAAASVAENVAEYMAQELGKDAQWIAEQASDFRELCKQYHF
ncbi:glycerol-3-phosphate dehydrogenase [Bisgaardia hudsonensis]|uniref:Glycerol-3-phosphate dehydrogenase n=1 Tax=Bisgaardia hudsonensis TaxID=109472 RepID=A0A4R2N0L5_9PAST|nr:glycerol-3-phosphate dehydrogenase/oxidase [Bisgaardia hudsonensis]QLB13519.1 FAD-dependent oxidoreductase [Bisgaardia hudsonensis]TCP12934.1 glycerol-3-phosphate dehydrogenase [Bisgaardia hudsonensis]